MSEIFNVSTNPHVRSGNTTQTIMRDVLIALTPASIFGIVNFGLDALLRIVIGIVTCVACEALYQYFMHKKVTVTDLSAAVTGLLIALNIPSTLNVGFEIVGCVIAIIVVIIAYVILKKTALGLYIESVGINGTASRLVGLNSTMIKFLTYLICGVLAGVAGFVASSRIYSADANNIGLNLEMDAILAVALGGNALGGGKFSLMGSVIGAYTIQALTTVLYGLNVSADQLPVYKAIVVVVIVVLQSPVFKKFIAVQKEKRTSKAAVKGGAN